MLPMLAFFFVYNKWMQTQYIVLGLSFSGNELNCYTCIGIPYLLAAY